MANRVRAFTRRIDTPLGEMIAAATDTHLLMFEFEHRRMYPSQLELVRRAANCELEDGEGSLFARMPEFGVSLSQRLTFRRPATHTRRTMTMKTAANVKDPVCGMDVETATAAGHTGHNGQTYYFCGSGCKQKFDLNPEQYSGKSGSTKQSGHGCCS